MKLHIYEQSDRIVIRSILFAEGIPTAEWFGHATRYTVGTPNFGANVATLLLLEEDVQDAARIIREYWINKYEIHDVHNRIKFLGVDVSKILPLLTGDDRASYPPDFAPLDPE